MKRDPSRPVLTPPGAEEGGGGSAPLGGRGLAARRAPIGCRSLSPPRRRVQRTSSSAAQQPAACPARDQFQFGSPVVAAVLGSVPVLPSVRPSVRPVPFAAPAGQAARRGPPRRATPTVTRVAKCLRSIAWFRQRHVTSVQCSGALARPPHTKRVAPAPAGPFVNRLYPFSWRTDCTVWWRYLRVFRARLRGRMDAESEY